ncbi:hypothetical protein QUF90_15190 [Desulfococcaceae bacterium HSG9]|nr:hypothetical protein [Desulfococcaceae bacterium HSG9]
MIRIGIDFDNTIICYDTVFHKAASEKGLIPNNFPQTKEQIRNYLRKLGQEDAWTELQGFVYGVKIAEAQPFPGVIDFFRLCQENDVAVNIISHKTKHPYIGPQYDLHQSAYNWMKLQNFFNFDDPILTQEQVFFEISKAEKISRIEKLKCTHFIDDLPEFLSECTFPKDVVRMLFAPNHNLDKKYPFQRFTNWAEMSRMSFNNNKRK